MYGILTLFSKTTGNSLAKDTIVCKKAHLYKIYALFSSMIGLGSLFTFRQNNKHGAFYYFRSIFHFCLQQQILAFKTWH